MNATPALTIDQHRVLGAVAANPGQTAIGIRDALGYARTRNATDNVQAVLADLVDLGLVERETTARLSTYTVAAQPTDHAAEALAARLAEAERTEGTEPGETVGQMAARVFRVVTGTEAATLALEAARANHADAIVDRAAASAAYDESHADLEAARRLLAGAEARHTANTLAQRQAYAAAREAETALVKAQQAVNTAQADERDRG